MTSKTGVALFAMLLALSFCSKDKGVAPQQQQTVHEKNDPQPARAAVAEAPLQVKTISLLPGAPTVLDDISAVPELADPGRENVAFQYQWFINGRESLEADGDKLGKAQFKKGAWIYCKVRAVADGLESAWLKCDAIRVHNSLPSLSLEPVKNFSVPGDIQYQAVASDPDGDDLTFEVISPLEQGIVIDPKTGALSWHLTEEIVKKLGEKIEIKIAVSDGEGEKISGTITLNLARTR